MQYTYFKNIFMALLLIELIDFQSLKLSFPVSGINLKCFSTSSSFTSFKVGGFHLGFKSLSKIRARTPEKNLMTFKKWLLYKMECLGKTFLAWWIKFRFRIQLQRCRYWSEYNLMNSFISGNLLTMMHNIILP